jgi:hypothetical protein
MRPKSSTRDTRLSNKNKGVVTKDEGEVGDGVSSPGAPNDKPSSAVEVNYPTEAKDATNNEDKKMPAIEKIKQARVQRQKKSIRKMMVHFKRVFHPIQICHQDSTLLLMPRPM